MVFEFCHSVMKLKWMHASLLAHEGSDKSDWNQDQTSIITCSASAIILTLEDV